MLRVYVRWVWVRDKGRRGQGVITFWQGAKAGQAYSVDVGIEFEGEFDPDMVSEGRGVSTGSEYCDAFKVPSVK